MPEAYTHVRTARAALEACGIACENKAALDIGANGPDPFFAYRVFDKAPQFPMARLGSRLHKQKCGAFLCTLVLLSTTAAQKAYTLGFLSHNATDALIHPYVAFITSAGQKYNRPAGHGFYEIALDCTLYKKDRGTRCIPQKDTAPVLTPLQLAEICQLLHDAVMRVYEEDIPNEGLADSFHDFGLLHKLFVSHYGFKKLLGFIAERFILRKPGLALSHMSPAKLVKELPKSWKNPFTGEEIDGDAFDLLPPAEQISTAFMKSAIGYWDGRLSFLQLTRLVGDHSYETGLASENNEALQGV